MLFGHGGDVYSLSRELGLEPAEVLDFSSNCSPLPYPDGFSHYLSKHINELHLLPEVDSRSVREILSARYGLSPESFLLGSGTTQWIFSLPRILGSRRAFIPLPTYSDYMDACQAAHVKIDFLGPYPDGLEQTVTRFSADLLALKNRDLDNALIFVCNPNNPTGLFMEPSRLVELIKRFSMATWVIDESYAPFVAEDSQSSLISASLPPNVVILRSFSKIYGIPGLRIGCLVTTGATMERLRAGERPWAVNRMAQLAAAFLLRTPDYEENVRQYCQHQKSVLVSAIGRLDGLEYVPGSTHFALFKVKQPLSAKMVCNALKKKGMLIRDCANFQGLSEEHIRISPRMEDDNVKLVMAIREIVSSE